MVTGVAGQIQSNNRSSCEGWLKSVKGKEFVGSILSQGLVPRFSVEIERGKYVLKTLTSLDELLGVFRLRFRVFHQEVSGENDQRATSGFTGYDIDPFDAFSDHLIVKDLETGDILGTYRLMQDSLGHGFYAETEFKLGGLLAGYHNPLEVSRACIEPGARQGMVLSLLWQGLMKYVQLAGVDFLFGCSSVWTRNLLSAGEVYSYLNSLGKVDSESGVIPKKELSFDFDQCHEQTSEPEFLSSLLRVYLKAGARVYGTPAYDDDFGCFDFLTGLNIAQVEDRYKNRFL